jgi:hypothetical protein
LKDSKGFILFDAAVLNDSTKLSTIQGYELYKNVKEQIIASDFTILGYIYWNVQYITRQYELNNLCIERRASELSEKEPEKAELFKSFLDYQKQKHQLFSKDVSCITWLLKTN